MTRCFVTGNAFRSRWCSVRQLTLDETQTAIDRSLRDVQSICDAVNWKYVNAYRRDTRRDIYVCVGNDGSFSQLSGLSRNERGDLEHGKRKVNYSSRVILDRCVFLSFFLSLSFETDRSLWSNSPEATRNDNEKSCHICCISNKIARKLQNILRKARFFVPSFSHKEIKKKQTDVNPFDENPQRSGAVMLRFKLNIILHV